MEKLAPSRSPQQTSEEHNFTKFKEYWDRNIGFLYPRQKLGYCYGGSLL